MLYFSKKDFSLNQTHFRSFDIVGIQVMTQGGFWKENNNKTNKHMEDLSTYICYFGFLLRNCHLIIVLSKITDLYLLWLAKLFGLPNQYNGFQTPFATALAV